MTAAQQRAAAEYLCEHHKVSQRRACAVLDCSRSNLRYRPKERPQDEPLVKAIQRLAREHPRWGYRFIHARLQGQGWSVNLKRVHRLWIELGLRRPVRRKKARKLGPKRGTSANSCTAVPARFKNDVWTCDFIMDRTIDGKVLKWLSVVDEYTRELLVLEVGTRMTAKDVRRILGRLIGWRGAPRQLRSDNGGEFVGEAVAGWLPLMGVKGIPVEPGAPWENGYAEGFHSRLRDEFLEREEFESEEDGRQQGRWFRREYNTIRPHSALGYKTPAAFSAECDRGLHGQPPKE